MISGRNRFPFTANQWQELEHQALIFKYMVAGMPIPSDLLFTVKRSLDSSITSKLLLHQPQQIGWNCLQMGFGRKYDPEPGRCRRTDGKKWRCSKEAYPDSKYCERHMHRGRNRSRKPVEVMANTNTTATTTNNHSSTTNTTLPISSSIPNKSPNPSSTTFTTSSNSSHHHHHHHNPSSYSASSLAFDFDNPHNHHSSYNHNPLFHHSFLNNPHSSAQRPPPLSSTQDSSTTHLLLDPSPYSQIDKDCRRNRYGQEMKEEADGQIFFSENSQSMRSSSVDDSWQLTMGSSLNNMEQRDCSGLSSGHSSYLQLHGHQQQQEQHQQCRSYGGGGDEFKFEMPLKLERDQEEPRKVMHHFFDEWPPSNRDSWLESEEKSSNSTTQLSISIPDYPHDFFTTTHQG